jgi:hypothetical protein
MTASGISRIKSLGWMVVGIAFPVAMVLLVVALLRGAAAVGARVLPFLSGLAGILIVFAIPVLLLAALARRSRGFASGGFVLISWVFGATLWIWALLFTLSTWGWLAVILGLLLAGVGIIPVALLSAAFHGEWVTVGQMLLGVFLTFGCRFFGIYLAVRLNPPDTPAVTE